HRRQKPLRGARDAFALLLQAAGQARRLGEPAHRRCELPPGVEAGRLAVSSMPSATHPSLPLRIPGEARHSTSERSGLSVLSSLELLGVVLLVLAAIAGMA